jgi:hypothetical protein
MFLSNVTHMNTHVNQWGLCDLTKHVGNNRAVAGIVIARVAVLRGE